MKPKDALAVLCSAERDLDTATKALYGAYTVENLTAVVYAHEKWNAAYVAMVRDMRLYLRESEAELQKALDRQPELENAMAVLALKAGGGD